MASPYGKPIMEYVSVPHDGWEYRITSKGWVMRHRLAGKQGFIRWYQLERWALEPMLAQVRESDHRKVTLDEKGDAVADEKKGGERKSPAKIREGAWARDLIATLPANQRDRVRRDAEAMARERGDNMLRGYYVYLVSGMEMPPRQRERWEYFERTGKEAPGTSREPLGKTPGKDDREPEKKRAAKGKPKLSIVKQSPPESASPSPTS